MKNNILDDIDDKSEEFDVLMNNPPRFYLRSGFVIIFFFLLLLGVASYYIDYPDYLSANVKVVSTNPRAPIISNIGGRLVDLKQNNTALKEGHIIGVIENTANTEDVLRIDGILSQFNIFNDSLELNTLLDSSFTLGELQPSFSNFLKAKNELLILLDIKSNETKISNLKGELFTNDNLLKSLREEKDFLFEKMNLSKSQLERVKSLYEKGVVSLNDLEIAKQKHIDIQNDFQSKISSIRQIEINSQKTSSNLSLTSKESDEINIRILSNYRVALDQIKTDIEAWKRKFLLTSPVDGSLVLNNIWASQQIALAGEEIGSVVPKDEQIFALAKLPELQSGKVFINSDVFIYLNGYNFSEFGVIKGLVKSISPVPYDGYYNLEIELVNGLVTDSNFSITFTPELSGEAKIITERMNLFQRLFYKLKRLFNREKKNSNDDENTK